MPCGLLLDFSLFYEGLEGFLAALGMTGGRLEGQVYCALSC